MVCVLPPCIYCRGRGAIKIYLSSFHESPSTYLCTHTVTPTLQDMPGNIQGVCTHTHIHTHTHTHIHTHTHTHTHTPRQEQASSHTDTHPMDTHRHALTHIHTCTPRYTLSLLGLLKQRLCHPTFIPQPPGFMGK